MFVFSFRFHNHKIFNVFLKAFIASIKNYKFLIFFINFLNIICFNDYNFLIKIFYIFIVLKIIFNLKKYYFFIVVFMIVWFFNSKCISLIFNSIWKDIQVFFSICIITERKKLSDF